MIPTPGFERLMMTNFEDVLDLVLDAIARAVDAIIKQPGMCPVDTGNLRGGHDVATEEKLVKYIVNSVYYWVFVVYGHITRGGGAYHGDAKGESGLVRYKGVSYVPPNNYLLRAITHAISGGYVQQIVDQKIKEVMGR